jgi:hypothetical protein
MRTDPGLVYLREPKALIVENDDGWRRLRPPKEINNQDGHGSLLTVGFGAWPCPGHIVWMQDNTVEGLGTALAQAHVAVAFSFNELNEPHRILRILADDIILWDRMGGTCDQLPRDYWDGLELHEGSWDQEPSDLMLSILGEENTPGWPGLIYVVLNDFELKEFGNHMPVFEAIIANEFEAEPASGIFESSGDREANGLAPGWPGYGQYGWEADSREIYELVTTPQVFEYDPVEDETVQVSGFPIDGSNPWVALYDAAAVPPAERHVKEIVGLTHLDESEGFSWVVPLKGSRRFITCAYNSDPSLDGAEIMVVDPETGDLLVNYMMDDDEGNFFDPRSELKTGDGHHIVQGWTHFNIHDHADGFAIYNPADDAFQFVPWDSGVYDSLLSRTIWPGEAGEDYARWYWHVWDNDVGGTDDHIIYRIHVTTSGSVTTSEVYRFPKGGELYDFFSGTVVNGIAYNQDNNRLAISTSTHNDPSDWLSHDVRILNPDTSTIEETRPLVWGGRFADPRFRAVGSSGTWAQEGTLPSNEAFWGTFHDNIDDQYNACIMNLTTGDIRRWHSYQEADPIEFFGPGAEDGLILETSHDMVYWFHYGDGYWHYMGGPVARPRERDLQSLLREFSLRARYDDADIQFHDFDAYGPLGFPIQGYWIDSRTPILSCIQELSSYYGVRIVESERALKYRIPPKGTAFAPDWTLTEEDLIPSDNGDPPLTIQLVSDWDLPQAVHAVYADPEQAYTYGTLRDDVSEAVLNVFPVPSISSRRLETIDAPLILEKGRARRAANEFLSDANAAKEVLTFRVGPQALYIEPASLGTLTMNDGTIYTLLVEETEIEPSTWTMEVLTTRYAEEERVPVPEGEESEWAEDVTPPRVTTLTNHEIDEDVAFSVEIEGNETISTVTLVGGADVALFSVVGISITMAAKDWDAPTDANSDNVYEVRYTVTDGSGNVSAFYTLRVTVMSTSVTLVHLTLSANTIAENSIAGTVVGAILGAHPDATLIMVDNDGNRFKITGGNVVAGSVPTDYETPPTTREVTIRQTLIGVPNSPLDTVLTIDVTDVDEGGGGVDPDFASVVILVDATLIDPAGTDPDFADVVLQADNSEVP